MRGGSARRRGARPGPRPSALGTPIAAKRRSVTVQLRCAGQMPWRSAGEPRDWSARAASGARLRRPGTRGWVHPCCRSRGRREPRAYSRAPRSLRPIRGTVPRCPSGRGSAARPGHRRPRSHTRSWRPWSVSTFGEVKRSVVSGVRSRSPSSASTKRRRSGPVDVAAPADGVLSGGFLGQRGVAHAGRLEDVFVKVYPTTSGRSRLRPPWRARRIRRSCSGMSQALPRSRLRWHP